MNGFERVEGIFYLIRIIKARPVHRGGHPGIFPGAHSLRGAPEGPIQRKTFFFNVNEGKKHTFWDFSGYKIRLLELSKDYSSFRSLEGFI